MKVMELVVKKIMIDGSSDGDDNVFFGTTKLMAKTRNTYTARDWCLTRVQTNSSSRT